MTEEGDIREIDNNWSEIWLNGAWHVGKKEFTRLQGEKEQFSDFIIWKDDQ